MILDFISIISYEHFLRNYYPFGLQHKGYNATTNGFGNAVAQRWKFGGKELQTEIGLGWYDITARNYDPALGRWMNSDPLAEQMRRHSPYNYAFDNPVYFIDPDGLAPNDWFKNKGDGRIVWYDSTKEEMTTEDGDTWENVGSNVEEVEESLDLPEDQKVEWTDVELVSFGNQNGGLFGVAEIESEAQLSFSLNIENAGESGLERIDGQTEITGVNMDMTVTSGTAAPLKLTGVGGNFGLNEWTALGKTTTNMSGDFKETPMLSNFQSSVAGKTSTTLSLGSYRSMQRTLNNGNSVSIGVNSTASFKLEQNGRNGFFSTATNIKIYK